MQHRGWLILVALWLAACTATPTASPTPPATAVAQLPTATASPRPATATRRPTITASPSATATRTRPPTSTPTFTPTATNTFDPQATVATATPAAAEVCVPTAPGANLPAGFLAPPEGLYTFEMIDAYVQQTLDYLDTAGPDKVLAFLAARGETEGTDFFYTDLTNDVVPELVFSPGGSLGALTVFGCQDGHYQLLLRIEPALEQSPRVVATIDLNRDGAPELVIAALFCGLGSCLGADVWAWNGSEFKSLIDPEVTHMLIIGGTFDAPPSASVSDVNGDGFIEVLLVGGIPSGGDRDYLGPWRVATNIYAWNGTHFAWWQTDFTAPEYRFQAVEDADSAVAIGDYAAAQELYDAVINDMSLDWWSPAKRDNWVANNISHFNLTPAPSPTPLPGDGGLERTQLSAYAYFRLALLHLLQGQAAEAQAAYDTLQAQYAASEAGRPYAELGAAFWPAYTAGQSIAAGCTAAQAYAAAHPDLLTPLGSDYHGWQSPTYTPEMICPVPPP